jgi:sec-independent protein translocase protein TatA
MIPGFPSVGGTELIILLVIILLLFGAKRIPDLARSLGRGTREFREGIRAPVSDDKDEVRDREKAEKVEKQSSLDETARGEQPHGEIPRAEEAEATRSEQKS